MAATSAASVGQEVADAVLEATSVGSLRAVNPTDGLFLRAEHLAVMQDYTRGLARALATATGPGVVHGLRVWLDDGTLVVEPGLAISPNGTVLPLSWQPVRPGGSPQLESGRRVEVSLADLQDEFGEGVWRVELHPATSTSGPAPVYDGLCAGGCQDGDARSPDQWMDEGAAVRVVSYDLGSLADVSTAVRRNAIASRYFERERAATSWLLPAGPGQGTAALLSNAWDDATALAAGSGVPLALLVAVGDRMVVDVWAARRLVDGTGAHGMWRGRLGMRPWSVFLAQVLQLEAELADDGVAPLGRASRQDDALRAADALLASARTFAQSLGEKNPTRRMKPFIAFEQSLDESRPLLADGGAQTGDTLVELPPAGYLPFAGDTAVESAVQAFFRGRVDHRVRTVRVDQVADEVLAAQHRDRIPLTVGDEARRPLVDVLVPSEPVDRDEIATTPYGWIAFVRRGPEPAEAARPATEDVDVYVHPWSDGESPEELARNLPSEKEKAGTLTYPVDSWAYPGKTVASKVAEDLEGFTVVDLVAVTVDREARSLASLRASLFGASLDGGRDPIPVSAVFDDTSRTALIVRFTSPR